MYNFKQISSINKSHCKGSTSVESNIYLSFDIDWCNNEVLEDTIDLIEPYQIAATWYVTHKTSLIDKIRKNHNFELGIHPNFNFLLDGDDRAGSNAEKIVESLIEIVPEAKSVRVILLLQIQGCLIYLRVEGFPMIVITLFLNNATFLFILGKLIME